jgi:cytochrome c oxidase cbb3-type subunit 3
VKQRYRCLAAATALSAALLAGCGVPPGQPRADSAPLTPGEVVEFAALYGDNCAGCHGANGGGGAAIALANPVYLAIADESALRERIANGVRGTLMPAFAQRAGGTLTEQQIDALVSGIRSRWSLPGILDGVNPPSYAPRLAGDLRRGEGAYQTYCESCHGSRGQGGPKGSAITNDSFLALASDQGLRTMIIAGRPELGAPDWRGNVAGRPMSEQEITDVVSWLASHRVATPGQPYITARGDQR